MFDPHAPPLVRPAVTPALAARVARESYGLDVGVKELGSNQDRNYLLTPARGLGMGTSNGSDSPNGPKAPGRANGRDNAGACTMTSSEAPGSNRLPVPRYLLKFDNDAFTTRELEVQNEAMLRLADAGVCVPTPLRNLAGEWISVISVGDDDDEAEAEAEANAVGARRADLGSRKLRARLLTFVEGTSLVDDGHLSPSVIAGLGTLAGGVVSVLADMDMTGDADALDRDLQWDMRNGLAVVEALAPALSPERRETVLSAARAAWATITATDAISPLPVQVIHGDISDDNVVGTRDALGRVIPTAVIDWGDLATGWRVAEIAVTVSAVLHHQDQAGSRPLDALPAITAFNALVPLTDAEVSVLWPLVTLRAAVIVAAGAHQLSLEPENDYVRDRVAHEWRIFTATTSVHPLLAEAAVRAALGKGGPEIPEVECRLVPALVPGHGASTADTASAANVVTGRNTRHTTNPTANTDTNATERTVANAAPTASAPEAETEIVAEIVALDATSPHLHRGAWTEPDIETRLVSSVVTRDRAAVFAYGEHRLTRSPVPGPEPHNAALVTEIHLPRAVQVVAPFSGKAVPSSAGLLLRGAFGEIELRGIDVNPAFSAGVCPVVAGAVLGVAGARMTIQWRVPGSPPAPEFTTASALPAWRRLTVDPAHLLGLSPVPALDVAGARARRAAAVPGAAERYYESETAPEIERGWRDLVIDTGGRSYVDMVNNVSAIGHAHPVLADAVHAQLLTLNTNCRFLYASLAEYVERLVALAPHPSLEAVLLVNSGSEAVDLALHLARLATGRRDVVVLREAYHGWTVGSDAVSTSAWENPSAAGSRPDWVHVVDAVNTYRGKHRGSDAGERYVADMVRLLDTLDTGGTPAGAFLAEPVFGNGGGITYPPNYLKDVYEAVRARGGVCIADEVQVGLGRLGHHTWGVEYTSVVPDILCVAKALGNGYPLGAVLTTRPIAAALERDGSFFSSAGGATASCVAGLAVLDVLRDEHLQENARVIGDHLAARLRDLESRYEIIGALHGMGLYQGIELVRDRTSKEPAENETAWVCERMLAYGVVVQPTSERRNVLKVKPPLVLTRQHADVFVDALDSVLAELEKRRYW